MAGSVEIRAIKVSFVDGLIDALTATGEATVADLKASSPKGRTGKYAAGWAYKLTDGDTSVTVYNSGKQSGLTHLLELGHRTRRGGHVAPREHIRPAHARNKELFLRKLREIRIEGN